MNLPVQHSAVLSNHFQTCHIALSAPSGFLALKVKHTQINQESNIFGFDEFLTFGKARINYI